MLGQCFAVADENKSPRQRCDGTINFGVHQVSQPDGHPADRHGDTDAVERPDIRHFILARKEPQSQQQTESGAVAGQPPLPDVEDFDRVREVVARVIEKAMSEPRADDRRNYAEPEDRVECLFAQPFALHDVVENVSAYP